VFSIGFIDHIFQEKLMPVAKSKAEVKKRAARQCSSWA
jgi:hypothetical protein